MLISGGIKTKDRGGKRVFLNTVTTSSGEREDTRQELPFAGWVIDNVIM